MKKTFTSFVAIAMLVGAASVAQAQALKVSTGSSTGTYGRMFKELSNVCSTQLQLTEVSSNGSNQNIDRIVGNEVNAAFVQGDVLKFRSQTEELGNIKTLLALHPEPVHVVTLTVSKVKEGGTMGYGAKPVVFNTVADLAGRTVAAAGGSVVTANVIRLQTEVAFLVVEYPSSDEALAAVANGTAHAALLVGGAPLGAPVSPGAKPTLIAGLTRDFKLLPFTEAQIGKLKAVYSPAKLNYSNVGAAGLASVSTDALFVTRQYTTPRIVEGLSKLRACALASLPELAETTGMHPAWTKVDASNKGKWVWYTLPEADAPKVGKK